MTYIRLFIVSLIAGGLLAACAPASGTPPPDTAAPTEAAPAAAVTLPAPSTATPTPTPLPPTATPTVSPSPSATPPTAEPPTAVPTVQAKAAAPAPTATVPPPTVAPPPLAVAEGKVLYHDGLFVDGQGQYKSGVAPWLDLLVRAGETWYGPERDPGDDIAAQPLPEGYTWAIDGGFAGQPNGEAWWVGPPTDGTARLLDPAGQVVFELPIHVLIY